MNLTFIPQTIIVTVNCGEGELPRWSRCFRKMNQNLVTTEVQREDVGLLVSLVGVHLLLLLSGTVSPWVLQPRMAIPEDLVQSQLCFLDADGRMDHFFTSAPTELLSKSWTEIKFIEAESRIVIARGGGNGKLLFNRQSFSFARWKLSGDGWW